MNPKDRAGAAKPNLSILPFAPLYEAIPAIYEGRRKYGYWNWRSEEISETIYADAAIRHLMQWIAGEDVDPDSGVHHVSKAIAGLLVVRDAMLHGTSIDDRSVDQNLNIPAIMDKLAEVEAKYPEAVDTPVDTPVDESKEWHLFGCDIRMGDRFVSKNGEVVVVTPSCRDDDGNRLTLWVRPVDGAQSCAEIELDKHGVAVDAWDDEWTVVRRAEDE